MGDTKIYIPWTKLTDIPWDIQLKQTGEALMMAPWLAISDWPYWLGFAGLEYASDYVQTAALENAPAGWRRLAGAVARGFVLSTNLHYWDEGH